MCSLLLQYEPAAIAEAIKGIGIFFRKDLAPDYQMVIQHRLVNKNKNPHERQYSNKIKLLALSIYFQTPSALKLCQKPFLLPSFETITKYFTQYDLKPGVNTFLFNFLSLKIRNFPPAALNCILCADIIPLKKHIFYNYSKDQITGFGNTKSHKIYQPATHALIIMIKGIKYNWTQPIVYYIFSDSFSNQDFIDTLMLTIRHLRHININIKAFISNQKLQFMNLFKHLQITHDKPYFMVDKQKVIYLFNPPNLLISTRNMFFKYILKIYDDIVDKKHLESFYSLFAANQSFSALTHDHIYPGPSNKTNLDLATDIFSSKVAAQMHLFFNGSLSIPNDSKRTIDFIDEIDKLFTIFNSSVRHDYDYTIFNRPFQINSPQTIHLFKMTEVFKSMKVFNKFGSDITQHLNCIDGWLVTISGLQMLWNSLNPTLTKEFTICTGTLNLNYLEKNILKPRHLCGNNKNPTSIKFIRAFKDIVCSEYFKDFAKSKTEDCVDLLLQINKLPSSDIYLNMFTPTDKNLKLINLNVSLVDYKNLNVSGNNAYEYICGYIMKKCLEKHICETCVNYASYQQCLDRSFIQCFFGLYSISDNLTFDNLIVNCNDFYNYIIKLENIFIKYFPFHATEDGVGAHLIDSYTNVHFNHPCEHFDKQFLLIVYTRFRIFTTIQFLNKSLLSEKNFKNIKLVALNH